MRLRWLMLRAELHHFLRGWGWRPMRCSKCHRRRWTEEIIVNFGWCNRCFDESWDAYMAGDDRAGDA